MASLLEAIDGETGEQHNGYRVALPAVGIALGAARSRRLDAVGTVVLIGIVVGSIAGAASGSAHLVLLDGVIPPPCSASCASPLCGQPGP